MASPPNSNAAFDRAYSSQDPPNARSSSQPPSRRNSDVHHIDAAAANAANGALEVPYQSQSAGWDTVDFSSGRNNSPGYPYTPSYRDSFTPYGSDSGVSWTGRPEGGSNQLYDDPAENTHDVEYNPADFDGPGSHSDAPSPYFLEQNDHNRAGMDSGLISSIGYNGDQIMSNQGGNSNDHFSPRMRTFSIESQNSYTSGNGGGTPHARMNSLDVNSFSPRPISAGSPASSVGGLDIERPRSRASSIGSVHQATPSLTVGPMGEAFDKLGFDPVESDLIWRNQQQQSQQAKSPPQLLIPNDPGPSSTLQIPSFGTQASGLNTGGLGLGGLSAPGINILPATPVSGGAGASNVPFDTVLKNLNHSRQNSGNGDASLGMMQSHATNTTFPTQQSSSRPSTPGPAHAQPTSFNNYAFSSPSPGSNQFQFPTGSLNSIPAASAQALENFLEYPGGGTTSNNSNNNNQNNQNNNNPPRPRALSDTSVRPVMAAVESQPSMPSFMGAHTLLSGGHFSPSFNSHHTPPLSSMSRSLASHRSNSFGSADASGIHFSTHPHQQHQHHQQQQQHNHDAAFNGLDVGLGADLRRGRGGFDAARHRPSRSEDFRSVSPFQPPDFLAPASAYGQQTPTYGYAGTVQSQGHASHASHGSISSVGSIGSSVGPTRHVRRLSSGSPYPDRGGAGSARASPYPSPNGSPSHLSQGLPGDSELGPDGNPWSKVERQQVTTPATAKASEGRRKGEASFVCPVPGCGSTFTRHFNLKGHLRSHNEERPFKCKWPGCEKGFARQHDCKRHEALHLNLRPYTCDGCKKTFARMDALNRHLKSEGGVDCTRGSEDMHNGMFDMGKVEDAHGWPIMNARANGQLAM